MILLNVFLALFVFCGVFAAWHQGWLPKIIKERSNKAPTGKLVRFTAGKQKKAFMLRDDLWVRLVFLILGPVALLCLSVAYAELVPLRVLFLLIVLPAYFIMLVLGLLYPKWGKRALVGFTAGVFATILYDIVRMGVMILFGLDDPITHIGYLLLGPELAGDGSYWWAGYLWRFFGNGAGLGITYAMLPTWFHNIRGGLIYGTAVGTGMLALLFFFPTAQLHLFILSFFVVVTGYLGHWAYGASLGWLFRMSSLTKEFERDIIPAERPITWQQK